MVPRWFTRRVHVKGAASKRMPKTKGITMGLVAGLIGIVGDLLHLLLGGL
ncbi:hypothetical protein SAMN05444695_101693 [Rhodococcus triatomae]|uniref:Uncharacterized protein n=1 Tax=Rhodococcus triatomae TaxID=300028 RepID=A0A1G8B9D4_9NOCA|nr:hypothetical protein SAMN05444695_101693 [Rhodococcus triatomae]